jgi:pSer/pThr/pTyr-binding forkhead associated (FHA) protein/tetratricopeptide (TPR) repeat protein
LFYLKLILHGADTGKDVALESGKQYTFGRGADCDIQLDEQPGISRAHFRVYENDGHWHVEVLSKFGNIIQNGSPVQSLVLDESTVFKLGDYDFKFMQKVDSVENRSFEPLPMASGQSEAHAFSGHGKTRSSVPIVFEGNADATQVASNEGPSGSPFIRIVEPGGVEKLIPLDGMRKWLAGRDALCEILLNDKKASRRQFEFSTSQQGFFVRDLGSANGTLLNGMPLAPDELKPLRSGDAIQVGQVTVHFELRDPHFEKKLMVISPSVYAVPSAPVQPQNAYEMINYPVPMGGAVRHEQYQNYDPSWEQGPAHNEGKTKKIRFVLFILALVFGVGAYLSMGTKEQVSHAKRLQEQTVNEPFAHLSDQKQKQVKENYVLAKNLFLQGKYDMAYAQLDKIHELIPEGYEDSRDMRDTIAEQRRLMEAKDQNDKELAKAEENRRIISENLRECEPLSKTTNNEAELRSCLSPTIQRDPGNTYLNEFLSRVQSRVARNFKSEADHKRYMSAVGSGRSLYLKAESLERSGDVYAAMDAYRKHMVSKYPDPDGLKAKAQAHLNGIQHSLSSKSEAAMREANAAYAAKNFKLAITNINKVKAIDPGNSEAAELNFKIRSELNNQLKEMWQEAVLSESFGAVPEAQKKWKQILELDHPDGDYYKKAKSKMRSYGGS